MRIIGSGFLARNLAGLADRHQGVSDAERLCGVIAGFSAYGRHKLVAEAVTG